MRFTSSSNTSYFFEKRVLATYPAILHDFAQRAMDYTWGPNNPLPSACTICQVHDTLNKEDSLKTDRIGGCRIVFIWFPYLP